MEDLNPTSTAKTAGKYILIGVLTGVGSFLATKWLEGKFKGESKNDGGLI